MKKLIWLLSILCACSAPQSTKQIDIQGHRGARGLLPENSIPGFLKAMELGVTTLELDLGVSKDSKIVVTHEPYLSHEICIDTTGSRIASDTLYNLYQMTYSEISSFDCGSINHPRFPGQQKIVTVKPLLTDVIDTVESYQLVGEKKINYNIELKTRKQFDNVYHPSPEVFSEMVYGLLSKYEMWDRVTIQSFDFRTLQYFHKQYPEVNLALLIENTLSWKKNIDSLGFIPAIYSSDYQLLSQESVSEIQKEGMLVIPWTVNDTTEMKKLIEWNVDGIITDYPDRAIKLTK